MAEYLQPFTYILIPIAGIIIGGLVAFFYDPSPEARSYVQHIAAGLIFAALATTVLPDLMEEHAPYATTTGFGLGVLVMLIIKRFSHSQGQKGVTDQDNPAGLAVTAGVDYVVDGLLIGIGFALGADTGLLLALALAVEALFLNLAVAGALSHADASPARIMLVTGIFSVLLLAGSSVGILFLSNFSRQTIAMMLAFGTAGLLYLVTEELLVAVEGSEVEEDPLLAGAFFASFLLLLIVEMNIMG